MKKYVLTFLFGVFVSAVLTGCLGTVRQQVERSEQGFTEAKFETYSRQVGAENGMSMIEINNRLPEDVSIKITMVEEEDIWRLFEVPGQDTLIIEVGTTDYFLEAETRDGTRDELFVPAGDATIHITDTWFDR